MWNLNLQRQLPKQALVLAFGFTLADLHGETITWSEHVAPILYQNCITCHREEAVAPFSLLSYDDSKDRAEKIVEAVGTKAMPPWMPAPFHGPSIMGERRLSDEEIGVISQWAEQGAKRGSSRRAPKAPKFSDTWTMGEPDLVLQLQESYTHSEDGNELFRNFVIPVPLTEPKHVQLVEFLPGAQSSIRQAIIQVDESDGSRRRDATDAGPGFPGGRLIKTLNSSGQFIGWSSGRNPYEAHEGTSWLLQPNTNLVVQLRMQATETPEVISPRIGLYFSEAAPTKPTDYFLLRSSGIDIPAGERNHLVEQSLNVPVAVSVLGILPRVHTLAKNVEVLAELPNGQQQWMLRIPEWDPKWQRDYRFEEPMVIPAGSKMLVRYTFDNSAANSRNPHSPPKRVILDQTSSDEVAEVFIELLLHNPEDRAAVQNAQLDFEMRQAGGGAEYFYQVGVEMEQLGRTQDAITAYERTVQEDSTQAKANNRLGAIYEGQGNKTQAEYYYREAMDADSSFHVARLNLGRFLRRANREQAAAKIFQDTLDIDPTYLSARIELSSLLLEQKLVKSAIKLLEDGLKLDPSEPYLNLQVGKLYVMDKKPEASMRFFEVAAKGTEENLKYEIPLNSVLIEAHLIPARMFDAGGNPEQMHYFLDQIFEIDPANVEARLMLVNKLLESRQEVEARKHLEFLLKLPPEEQPAPPQLIAILSFPQGVRLLADVYKRTQRAEIGKGILTQALDVAKQRRHQIWITQLQNDLARYR